MFVGAVLLAKRAATKTQMSQSDDRTKFLINGFSFDDPDDPVTVLLQILNGQGASKFVTVHAGSIYLLGRGKSVEIPVPGGVVGGPVGLRAGVFELE